MYVSGTFSYGDRTWPTGSVVYGTIPVTSSAEDTLQALGLASAGSARRTGIRPRPPEVAPNVKAGAVAIPRSETMRKLPENVGALHRSSATAEADPCDTVPFPVVTEGISAAMLPAMANAEYGQLTVRRSLAADSACSASVPQCLGW